MTKCIGIVLLISLSNCSSDDRTNNDDVGSGLQKAGSDVGADFHDAQQRDPVAVCQSFDDQTSCDTQDGCNWIGPGGESFRGAFDTAECSPLVIPGTCQYAPFGDNMQVHYTAQDGSHIILLSHQTTVSGYTDCLEPCVCQQP